MACTLELLGSMRAILLTLSLLPYVYYGYKDNMYHFHGRKVSRIEHMLHLAIGIILITAIGNAYAGRQGVMIAGLLLFLAAGSLDEYWFHRDIPEVESDLHAKEHLGLMIFVVVSIATDLLEKNHWDFKHLLS